MEPGLGGYIDLVVWIADNQMGLDLAAVNFFSSTPSISANALKIAILGAMAVNLLLGFYVNQKKVLGAFGHHEAKNKHNAHTGSPEKR